MYDVYLKCCRIDFQDGVRMVALFLTFGIEGMMAYVAG